MDRLQLLEFATIRKHCYGSVKNPFLGCRGSRLRLLGREGESHEDLQEPDGSLPKACLRRAATDG
jgi:hypothetical protein